MRIGGRWGIRPAVAAVRKNALRIARTPLFGVAVITPLVFAGAVGGAAPAFPGKIPPRRSAITPVAAVNPSTDDPSGPIIISIKRPPTSFHFAAANLSAPPPPIAVNSPGALGIPIMALTAYRNAEQKMTVAAPNCGVSWNLLAGIGRIESMHANGGATDEHGTAISPIYGPALDGTLPGNEVIIQSRVGNRVTYARAMGPMQFLPGTWARYASDGDSDGVPDPQNLFDSTLAAARYLCSGGLNLRNPTQVMAAILRYNNSMSYAQNVLGWAAAYATGVVPVDLPPITGPPPPLGDAHLEHPKGLGPDLPVNVHGLRFGDPYAQVPIIDLSPRQAAPPQPLWPWLPPPPPPAALPPGCTLICIASQNPPPAPPPGIGPPPVDPLAPAPSAALPPPAPLPNPLAPPPPNPLAPPPGGPIPGVPDAPPPNPLAPTPIG